MLVSTILWEAIWVFINTDIQAFFWVTIIFMIIERTVKFQDDTPVSFSGKKWTPKDLDHIAYIPLKRKITTGELFFSLFWTVLFIILYLNADHLIGIYQSNRDGLQFVLPVFNQSTLMSFLAFVIIVVAFEIFNIIYKAISKEWTVKLAISNMLVSLVSFIVLIIIFSQPDLLHTAFAPHMANLTNQSLTSVNQAITWIKWSIVAIVFVTSLMDVYQGFKKARIK